MGPDEGRVHGGVGDARGRGGARHRALHRPQPARQGDPRNGLGADGEGSQDLGPERAQPGVGDSQPLHHRRLLHGLDGLRESVHHLHGPDRPRGELRGGPSKAEGIVNDEQREEGRGKREGYAVDRRTFVSTLSAVAASSMTLPPSLLPHPPNRIPKIGLQLYTLRDKMKTDVEDTLEKVAETGYQEVEFAGYFDKTPAQIRHILDAHGLVSPSAHVPYESIARGWSKVLDDAHVVGHTFITVAWIPQEVRPDLDG